MGSTHSGKKLWYLVENIMASLNRASAIYWKCMTPLFTSIATINFMITFPNQSNGGGGSPLKGKFP